MILQPEIRSSHHTVSFADGGDPSAYKRPMFVTADGWIVSYSTGDGIDGAELRAHRGRGAEYHELHGTSYPTAEAARIAAFEAGLLNLYFSSFGGTR